MTEKYEEDDCLCDQCLNEKEHSSEDTIFSILVTSSYNVSKQENIVRLTFSDQEILSFTVKLRHFSIICSSKRADMGKEHCKASESIERMDKNLLLHFAKLAIEDEGYDLNKLKAIEVNSKMFNLDNLNNLHLQNILYENVFYQDSYSKDPILNDSSAWELIGQDSAQVV